MLKILYSNNDMLVELEGLKNAITGAHINNATVTVTVQRAGTDVEGATFPITMDYVSGTRGVYRGVVPAALEVSEGETVDVIVSVSGGGLVAEFKCPAKVKDRC